MKSLRFALLFILTCSFAKSYGQDVVYSQYEKYDFRTGDYAVVGMTGGRLYNYRNSSDGAMLDAFDDSMNKVATVLLDFFPEKIYQTRFIAYNDKIILLYQSLEGGKVVQYAALLDDKGRLKNKPIELGDVRTGLLGATRTYFSAAISENKKSILVYKANDKGSEVEFEGKWLDDNLAIIKRSHATFKTDNNVEHGEINIANDGTIYMAAYTPVGTRAYADQYWIATMPAGGNKFESKELPLGDRYATAGYTRIDNMNNKVYFGGFYSNKKNGNFDGIIFASYDIATGDYTTKRFIAFDEEMLKQNNPKHKNHSFDNYEVRQVIPKSDGGFVMISEQHYVTTRNNYTPGFGYYSYYNPYSTTLIHEYHYNDIMALSYNKDGAREWEAYVPKEQYSQEDNGVFSSYALLNTGGTLAFLYNDFNIHHSRVQLATISSEGKADFHGFATEGTNNDADWLPKAAKQVASRVLIVPCFHKKQICFAKVVF